ncbi:MOSC domain-containing protein [Salinarimonas ramus]|uniref:Metal-sulfur cluster biosynthesis proteins YuaD n=1 Tax=Salinarimonas ramus TaxID=690164 RepID=A0A917V2V6_9HYPH|nr:MOSC domain-containing protein [Salinarimonas ramus]GGK26467.1 putative metal-sulfur cluster biosynthesis proteins YuaD [Salinarimonas ramus]
MHLARLLLAPGPDFLTHPVEEARLVFGGIEGDLHAGATRKADARTPWHARGTTIANTRQVSLVSLDELALVAAALEVEAVYPAHLGANLVLADAPDLTATAPGTRMIFPSGATLFVTEANPPCRQPGRKIAAAEGRRELEFAFVKAAKGRRGLVALVEREGAIRAGDAIKVLAPTRG